MVIAWDVDGTLFSYKNGFPLPPSERKVRPYAREVIDLLEHLGVENHLWSRAGRPNACEAAEILGLPPERCHPKTKFPEELDTPFKPDLVIDDNPDEPVLIFPHILVSTYEDGEDQELLDILPEIRRHFDALVPDKESLSEVRVRWKRKRRIPLRIKMKRRRYYRRRRAYMKRYRRKWKRRPRTKRLMRIRKRLIKRFGRKLRRYRMRVVL